MANNPKTHASNRALSLNAAFDVLNSGTLRYADGTQPTDAGTAVVAQVNLADLPLGATAFAAASTTLGTKAANAITSDTNINASGTASWASLFVSGNGFSAQRVMDMSVGTSAADMIVNSTAFSSGATAACSSLTISQAA